MCGALASLSTVEPVHLLASTQFHASLLGLESRKKKKGCPLFEVTQVVLGVKSTPAKSKQDEGWRTADARTETWLWRGHKSTCVPGHSWLLPTLLLALPIFGNAKKLQSGRKCCHCCTAWQPNAISKQRICLQAELHSIGCHPEHTEGPSG